MQDDDVTNPKGIWEYVLTRDEKYLNIRAFSDGQKAAAYERSGGICAKCGGHFEFAEMEADHITPWHDGGATTPENCQMLCCDCNRRKSGKYEKTLPTNKGMVQPNLLPKQRKRKYPESMGTISGKLLTFVVSYLTCETPQEAEIRTVAKSLPKPDQNSINGLLI